MSEGEAREVDPKYTKLVETIDVSKGLRPGDMQKIFHKGMTMTVKKGDTLFYKGTVGSQMYVVLGGSVGIFDGQKQLATLRTGDTFGEMSLIMHESRNATAIAMEASSLFVLNEDIFQRLLTKRVAVQILLNISRMLGKRLNDANAAIVKAAGS